MSECKDKPSCFSRRDFLVKSAFFAGGAVLTVSALGNSAFAGKFEDVTIEVATDGPLAKAGGYQIVDSTARKIIVINEDGTNFAAFSAKCTHKGVTVKYDAASGMIKCPAHGSQFDGKTGAVAHGPADDPLKSYAAKENGTKVTVTIP
jgi:cytochrome b6-f complex iron-sulfur subunit